MRGFHRQMICESAEWRRPILKLGHMMKNVFFFLFCKTMFILFCNHIYLLSIVSLNNLYTCRIIQIVILIGYTTKFKWGTFIFNNCFIFKNCFIFIFYYQLFASFFFLLLNETCPLPNGSFILWIRLCLFTCLFIFLFAKSNYGCVRKFIHWNMSLFAVPILLKKTKFSAWSFVHDKIVSISMIQGEMSGLLLYSPLCKLPQP